MPEPPNFAERAWLEEEIDGACSFEDLRDCLRDLARVNRLVFTHRPILLWLERIAAARPRASRPLRIVDVGCGYGDLLRRIERWSARRGVAVELTGVDINANTVRAAREATGPSSHIHWIHGDAITCEQTAQADLIATSGVTHHMRDDEIVRLIAWMERSAAIGWFICDLHRKPVPYRLFNVLMRGWWWHRFIRPDGLRSIRRSFLAEDWQRMCAAAGLEPGAVRIDAYRPARLCVERSKG